MIRVNSTIDSLTIRDIKTDEVWLALCNGMKVNITIRDLTLGNTSNIWNLELSVTACQCLKTILIHGRNLQCLRLKSFTIPRKESAEEICSFQISRSWYLYCCFAGDTLSDTLHLYIIINFQI